MPKTARERYPSQSLPVIFVRVPQRTHDLAMRLAQADQRSLSQWITRLIEAQRKYAPPEPPTEPPRAPEPYSTAQVLLHDDGPL
jgi:hypothetical protein